MSNRMPASRRGGALAAALLLGAVLAASLPALAREQSDGNRGDGLSVDHDGIYLAQREGRCLNGTGPCYFGGQCPGGEFATNRYANGRVYCGNFYPPRPYPAPFWKGLFGGW